VDIFLNRLGLLPLLLGKRESLLMVLILPSSFWLTPSADYVPSAGSATDNRTCGSVFFGSADPDQGLVICGKSNMSHAPRL
jgi:hypothetical protein